MRGYQHCYHLSPNVFGCGSYTTHRWRVLRADRQQLREVGVADLQPLARCGESLVGPLSLHNLQCMSKVGHAPVELRGCTAVRSLHHALLLFWSPAY
jgi:hypothetical protein